LFNCKGVRAEHAAAGSELSVHAREILHAVRVGRDEEATRLQEEQPALSLQLPL